MTFPLAPLCLFLCFLFFSVSSVFGQSTVSIASEISRLEKPEAAGTAQERYNAFLSLAWLNQLSGNYEAATKAYDGALSLFPSDGKALLEQGRLFLSLGEYEKAAFRASSLLAKNDEKESVLQGRLLMAQIEAFRSGSLEPLAALADDPGFSGNLSGIYYTLFKLSGLSSWKTRLLAEFPGSPEAKIFSAGNAAGNSAGKVAAGSMPLWLLFPGRESIALSAPPTATQPTAATPLSSTPAGNAAVVQTSVLQTGLFGKIENAQALADRLKKAGFSAEITRRIVNGSEYFAVTVPGGNDVNGMIKKLKDSGFDSFPVN